MPLNFNEMKDSKTTRQVIDSLRKEGVNKVKLAITDIDGVLRGKIVSIEKFESIIEGGFGFCEKSVFVKTMNRMNRILRIVQFLGVKIRICMG